MFSGRRSLAEKPLIKGSDLSWLISLRTRRREKQASLIMRTQELTISVPLADSFPYFSKPVLKLSSALLCSALLSFACTDPKEEDSCLWPALEKKPPSPSPPRPPAYERGSLRNVVSLSPSRLPSLSP